MKRKILIAVGIVLLFAFHVVAAFALGVYVGRYGFTRDGLTLRNPAIQAAPTGQDQPAPVRQLELPGIPNVVGRIRLIEPVRLNLATRDGQRIIFSDDKTQYRDTEGENIDRDILEKGDIVAVYGEFQTGAKQMLAHLVILLPDDVQPRAP